MTLQQVRELDRSISFFSVDCSFTMKHQMDYIVDTAVKTMNVVRSSALNLRGFEELLEETKTDHKIICRANIK
jgi:hypothetical protein